MGLLIPAAYFAIAFGALWQSYRDPQARLPSLSENATALVFFGIFAVLGFPIADRMRVSAHGRLEFYLIVGFCFSWACLCVLWLIRKAPQANAPPEWLLSPWDAVDRYLLWIAGLCMLLTLS